MPLATIASAICRTRVSLILHPNVFQLFHPIGGVRATPFSSAAPCRSWATNTVAARTPAAKTGLTRRRELKELMAPPTLLGLSDVGLRSQLNVLVEPLPLNCHQLILNRK